MTTSADESSIRLLSNDDEGYLENESKAKRLNYRIIRPYQLGFSLILNTIFIVYLLVSVSRHTSQYSQHSSTSTIFGSCGSTTAEAKAHGCIFDPISFSWLPPECSEVDLIGEFLDLQNWKWFKDLSSLDEISMEEVLRGELEYAFVTREYHVFHCTYQWRKMHLGLLKGVIDTYIANYTHTGHCEHMITEHADGDSKDTIIMKKFVQCQLV